LDVGKLGLELNWKRNSKSRIERKWLPIPIPLFGCVWNFLLETEASDQFQFLFGCTNHGIGCFVGFRQYKLVCMYGK
jgi:hypothetical protein